MTQENKDLLVKDLCARLPYGVKLQRDNVYDASKKEVELLTVEFLYENEAHDNFESLNIKPYLRPMSSMTEEEKKEYHAIDSRAYTCPEDIAHIPAADRIDWLISHHFDYRGLIPMGLALEAPEGMYKTE